MKNEKHLKSPEEIVKEICAERGVDIKDVNEILSLYGSDLSEEEIEGKTSKYPPEALRLATGMILGNL